MPKLSNLNTPSQSVYTKAYSSFAGVDFSNNIMQVDDIHSPHAPNMVSDAGGYPEKRVGWRVLKTLTGKKINGIFYYNDGETECYIVHAGTVIYKWEGGTDTPTELKTGVADNVSTAKYFKGSLIILTGTEMLVFDGTNISDPEPKAYIPTTVIGREVTMSSTTITGTKFQDINMLTPYRRISFSFNPNDTADCFYLDGKVDENTIVYMRYVDKQNTFFWKWDLSIDADTTHNSYPAWSGTRGWHYDGSSLSSYSTAKLIPRPSGRAYIKIYLHAPDDVNKVPYTEGIDNFIIEYCKTTDGYAERINKCTFCEIYENRVFFSGNPDYPNTDWYSGVNDPLYVPDLNYTEIGTENSKIMGYLKTGDSLAIIKEDGAQDATVFMRTSTYDDNGEMIFPVPKQNQSGIGAVSTKAIQGFMDDPVFLSSEGLYGIGKIDITAERVLEMRSTRVNPKLTQETLSSAIMAVWRGYLLVCIGSNVYVANSRQRYASGNSYEYEWYYWTNIPARCFCVDGDALYFGTADGNLCRFNNDMVDANGDIQMTAYNDNGAAITAEWSTKLDDDGDFMTYKTLPKKGTGVLFKTNARSSCSVSIRTEKELYSDVKSDSFGIFTFTDIDFDNFTFNTSPYTVIPINTKIKKYKAIQIICKNDTVNQGFGIYKIIRRYFVGNYVK